MFGKSKFWGQKFWYLPKIIFILFLRYNRSTFYKPSFDEPDFVCSLPEDGGTSRCSNISPKDTNCSGSFEDNSIICKKYYNICKEVGPNPFYDLVSFDNIGIAWIVIFQVNFWKDSKYLNSEFSNSLIYKYKRTYCWLQVELPSGK